MAPFKSSRGLNLGKQLKGYRTSTLGFQLRVAPVPVTVTGGTLAPNGIQPGNDYQYHVFTSSGSLVVANGDVTADYLIVGGGGGGSGYETSGNAATTGGYGGGAAPARGSFWGGAGDGVTPPGAPPMTYALSLTTASAKANSGSGGGGGGFGRPTYSSGNQQHRSGSGGSGIVVIAYPT